VDDKKRSIKCEFTLATCKGLCDAGTPLILLDVWANPFYRDAEGKSAVRILLEERCAKFCNAPIV
jgi:hypothetical protein